MYRTVISLLAGRMIAIIILVVSTSALASPLYQGECQFDTDCSYYQACRYSYCENPCTGACGYLANCKVSDLAWSDLTLILSRLSIISLCVPVLLDTRPTSIQTVIDTESAANTIINNYINIYCNKVSN